MTKKVKSKISEADIWNRRKEALLEIANHFLKNLANREKSLEKTLEESGITVRDLGEVDSQDFEEGMRGLKKMSDEDGLAFFTLAIVLQAFKLAIPHRQKVTSRLLLERLIQFTKDAADFLEPSYEINKDYSPRYLWRVLLNEVSTDLQIIQAAVQARTPENDNMSNSGDPTRVQQTLEAETLFTADIIAKQSLGQAIQAGFLKQTPIITYLKKDISIRTVPYAEVLFISVAYATMQESSATEGNDLIFYSVSRDLLAIPHEVGHHLLMKGQIPGRSRTIHKHLQKRLIRAKIWEWDWRHRWLEEIFADAYGCLVAGPVMVLSFQDMLTDNPPAHFREDRGHHPIPVLRPYIQTRILRNITDANGNSCYKGTAKRLDQRWEKWLAANFSQDWADVDPLLAEYKLRDVPHLVQGQRILETLDEIIKIVLRTLRGQRPPNADANWTHGGWKAWTTELQKNEELVGLYDKLSLEIFFPFSNRWLQKPVVASQESLVGKWPERILSDWAVKGPEDRGTG